MSIPFDPSQGNWKYLDSKLILEAFSFPLSIANHGEINSVDSRNIGARMEL